jgi:hypothetical protein
MTCTSASSGVYTLSTSTRAISAVVASMRPPESQYPTAAITSGVPSCRTAANTVTGTINRATIRRLISRYSSRASRNRC